jgi:hypothetical protein
LQLLGIELKRAGGVLIRVRLVLHYVTEITS